MLPAWSSAAPRPTCASGSLTSKSAALPSAASALRWRPRPHSAAARHLWAPALSGSASIASLPARAASACRPSATRAAALPACAAEPAGCRRAASSYAERAAPAGSSWPALPPPAGCHGGAPCRARTAPQSTSPRRASPLSSSLRRSESAPASPAVAATGADAAPGASAGTLFSSTTQFGPRPLLLAALRRAAAVGRTSAAAAPPVPARVPAHCQLLRAAACRHPVAPSPAGSRVAV